jgi:hypothetical protein
LTIAQHLLQNLSPGLIEFPHDRQDLPDTGCTGAVYCAGCGTGGENIGDTGAGAGFTVIEAPHSPQNFISMPITAPHAGQGRVDGGGGTGISGTTGVTFLRVEPQLPQNFSSGAPMVPHDRQTGDSCGGMGISTGSGTGCDASASEAPQCRQNFAFGTLLCPHSGQYTIIISNELLAGIHKIGTVDPIDRAKEQIQKVLSPDFYFSVPVKKFLGRNYPVTMFITRTTFLLMRSCHTVQGCKDGYSPNPVPGTLTLSINDYSVTAVFARFTRSFVEKPVAASRNFLNRLFVSMITSSADEVSDSVSTMMDFSFSPIVTSSRFNAPNRIRYPFPVFSGSVPKQFFSSAAILILRSFVKPRFIGYSCILFFR